MAVALDGEALEAVLVYVTFAKGAERCVKTSGVRSRQVLKVLGKLLFVLRPNHEVSVIRHELIREYRETQTVKRFKHQVLEPFVVVVREESYGETESASVLVVW
jgi:hypothetical protein